MIEIGLTQEQKNLICTVLKKYPAVDMIKLYGSRAKGCFNDRSDIDLVAYGKNLDRFIITKILLDFDDLDIPFIIELQEYKNIKNKDLREHIDRVGIIFYKRPDIGKELQ